MHAPVATFQLAAHQLLEPSYENRLRVIGRELDHHFLSNVILIEFDAGFVARGVRRDGQGCVALEFLDAEFPERINGAIQARGEGETPRPATPMLPTGYEDFLRGLGHELDLRIAEGIAIAEYHSFITVSALVPGFDEVQYDQYSEVLSQSDVREILDEAFRRRGDYQPISRYEPRRRGGTGRPRIT